ITENGKTVLRENTKRVAFLEFAELPRRTRQPLELALYTDDRDAADLARLTQNGWRVRHSTAVAGSPDAYRAYVQRPRREFCCSSPPRWTPPCSTSPGDARTSSRRSACPPPPG